MGETPAERTEAIVTAAPIRSNCRRFGALRPSGYGHDEKSHRAAQTGTPLAYAHHRPRPPVAARQAPDGLIWHAGRSVDSNPAPPGDSARAGRRAAGVTCGIKE